MTNTFEVSMRCTVECAQCSVSTDMGFLLRIEPEGNVVVPYIQELVPKDWQPCRSWPGLICDTCVAANTVTLNNIKRFCKTGYPLALATRNCPPYLEMLHDHLNSCTKCCDAMVWTKTNHCMSIVDSKLPDTILCEE